MRCAAFDFLCASTAAAHGACSPLAPSIAPWQWGCGALVPCFIGQSALQGAPAYMRCLKQGGYLRSRGDGAKCSRH
jgi:hypothetical protein